VQTEFQCINTTDMKHHSNCTPYSIWLQNHVIRSIPAVSGLNNFKPGNFVYQFLYLVFIIYKI